MLCSAAHSSFKPFCAYWRRPKSTAVTEVVSNSDMAMLNEKHQHRAEQELNGFFGFAAAKTADRLEDGAAHATQPEKMDIYTGALAIFLPVYIFSCNTHTKTRLPMLQVVRSFSGPC